jgi:hypothetical protein
MSPSSPQPRRTRRHSNTLVAKYSFLWVIAAALLSLSEVVSLGTVTAPVLALDIVAGAHLPFGVVSLVAANRAPVGAEEPPADDDSNGGGGSKTPGPDPTPPSGGIAFDWDEFETAFRAYAHDTELAPLV